MASPLPPVDLAAVIVEAPRLPPLGGEAIFSARRLDASDLASAPRLDAALRSVPGVSLFRRTGSEAANPTIQGISLRNIAPSGAGRALVTLDGVPVNDPFGGWVIWSALPPESLEAVKLVRGAGAGAYGAGALTGVIALSGRVPSVEQRAIFGSVGSFGGKRLVGRVGSEAILISGGVESSDGYTPVRAPTAGAVDVPSKFNAFNLSGQILTDWNGIKSEVHLGGYQERRSAGLVGANSMARGQMRP